MRRGAPKFDDVSELVGPSVRVCPSRSDLDHLYHLASSASYLRAIIKKVGVLCFFVVYLKAVLFVFVSFYSDDCR